MKTKQIDDKTYYMNDDGMIMFSLYKPTKTNHAVDYTTDEMWCVKCMYPASYLGVWKFFDREDAEAWIQDQIDLDTLNVVRRRKEIIAPTSSLEDNFEKLVQSLVKVHEVYCDRKS